MGIRFTANTWRAPLQLIDCWLPAPHPNLAGSSKLTPRLLQRFVKAGWLHRASTPHSAPIGDGSRSSVAPCLHPSERSTRLQQGKTIASCTRSDGRLLLSGRIDQVCAELERLAALEQRMFR